MTRPCRHRRPAAWALLILALLVQAFAPDWAALVMRATTAPTGAPMMAAPMGAMSDLCLAADHAADHAPETGGRDQPSPHGRQDGLCPVCQVYGVVQLALGCAPPPDMVPRQAGCPLRRHRRRSLLIRLRGRRPCARGPPTGVRHRPNPSLPV